jgi:hypothetical protein
MIVKGVARVLGIDVAEFPKVKHGEKPWDEVTYWDRESRDRSAVTILIDRQVPVDTYPREGEDAVLVLQVEEVARVVKRQDRDDPGRTYEAATKQFKARVVGFEPAPAKAKASPAKAAA